MLVSSGVVLGLLATRGASPAVLSESTAIERIEPVARDFDDARTVELVVDRADGIALTVPVAGRVTTWVCREGAELRSGQAAIAVDGTALLGLATETPLWRDLAVGDEGSDVAAVQQSLVDLGEEVVVDARLGPATVEAFARVRARAMPGARTVDGVPAAAVFWLPASTVRIGECPVDVGESVAADQAVARTVGSVAAARVAVSPSDAVPGAREIEVGGVVVPLTETGEVADAASLAAIAATDEVIRSTAASEAAAPTATWKLVEPVQVSAVPPGALFGIEGTRACIADRGRPIPVRLVASDLGRSLVAFDADPPERVDVTAPEGATCP